MLRHKDTTIVSEIKDFFTSSQKAVSVILDILSSLKFSDKHFGFSTACNLQFSSKLKLMLLILFPFFQVNDPAAYAASGIYVYFTPKVYQYFNPKVYHLKLICKLVLLVLLFWRYRQNSNTNKRLVLLFCFSFLSLYIHHFFCFFNSV